MSKNGAMAKSNGSKSRWMIYGANGYTGVLVAEEAARRGHRPLLAGRNADKVRPLAERLGLPFVALDLHDEAALRRALADLELVFHAAGPFVDTSDPMIRACLATRTHYVDITGEVPVFRNTYGYDQLAREAGVVLMSGVGFDVVPTDCLALYVAKHLPGITELEIAIAGIEGLSAGTAKSMLDGAGSGMLARRDGLLRPLPFGKGGKRVRFVDRERSVLPIPWGDLESGYRSTGVPNITTYMAFPRKLAEGAEKTWRLSAAGAPLLRAALARPAIRGLLGKLIERRIQGPDPKVRKNGKAFVWVGGRDAGGRARDAWLQTPDAYTFTALSGVRSVEHILARKLAGALTPSAAFGEDFVLEIEGVERFDQLP
ncbi:MAG: integral rane protein [Myxococcaceae bacterium]|nr:integral rane protein [Myxococcaceae bacterium]